MNLKKVLHCSPRCLYLMIGCVLLWIWVMLEYNFEEKDALYLKPHSELIEDKYPEDESKLYLIFTNGCRIPDLDPMSPAVEKFIYDERPIDCVGQYGPALVESNLTAVYLNKPALTHYNVTDPGQISCCYRPFWREESSSGKPHRDRYNYANVRFSQVCTPFHESAAVSDEFVRIECSSKANDSLYKDFHAFFPKKPTSSDADQEKRTGTKNKVNVVIFGVDSVSRMNFYRQMPQTLEFLKTLNAVEMLGYNMVGRNTFENMMPVLAGLSVGELTNICWQKRYEVFDNCHFIWENYSDLGYKTAFAEDASWLGLFQYMRVGFRKQPTDYSMRVFNKVAEKETGFEKRKSSRLCVGPRKNLDTLFNYAYKFLVTMKDVLTFAFFWGASLSHDFLNLPMLGDKDHKVFLETLYNHGVFNNTIMLFMSDHGMRWGGIHKTSQGYLEERLPFLFVVYPHWFREKYVTAFNNLRTNALKLTTPFDVHELLKDLTDLSQLEEMKLRERTEQLQSATVLPRGISLFLPISENRTCLDAGIVDNLCTCYECTNISMEHIFVRLASESLVTFINFLLENHPQCVQLKLLKVVQARQEKPTCLRSFEKSFGAIIYLSITIETTPGNGLFEATLRLENSFIPVGKIRRINDHLSQSTCLNDYKLKMYCYCYRFPFSFDLN